MQLEGLLDRLAAFEPAGYPVLSLYLDTRRDGHGRDRHDTFVRKELPARIRTYSERSPQRESLDRDAERVRAWLDANASPTANAIAIFACAGSDDMFEAVQLEAPLDGGSELFVGARPHLYPLARLHDRYRRYAAVVTDTNTARIFVLGLGTVEVSGEITNVKARRSDAGGWSQARFQRHMENYHLQHVKEVVDTLERVVREEGIERVVLAGDEVVIPRLREQLPKALQEKVVDVLRLEVNAPEDQVLRETLAAMREQDARDDAEKVRRAVDAYRAGGLGAVGVSDTLAALRNGQVHELLLTADRERIDAMGGEGTAETLVTQARQTGAEVTFIEDPDILADVGGVAARLRYRIRGRAA